MLVFDKVEIRESLTLENIFNLLLEWGGQPEYNETGLIAYTICHNPPGEANKKKLYFYENSKLFHCYTGCDSFDIFDLTIKVFDIQNNQKIDLNDAVRYIAAKHGYYGSYQEEEGSSLEDWKIFSYYDNIHNIDINTNNILTLKEYDKEILNRFNYKVKIKPWLDEGITEQVLKSAQIGFYAGKDQITIPHFDKDNRFIGLRGRTLCQEEGEKYGKYRPLKINKNLYNHPLGMNLYNLNKSINNIKLFKKAIVFESEKATLQYRSYFGEENDISVACCGSNLTQYQIRLLKESGAEEIIVGFDRQFQEIGDDEFKKLKNNLLKLYNKYKNFVKISFIFDSKMLTNYKDSPTDLGPEIFLQLFKERIVL